ncbi:MAG: hypothetical protein H6531_08010 [Actinobacteria bacterium]|nr:hypothetical protein [Thermoleophilia bacterium]MCB9011761.1 hypothetical protein [Actinomycetota bacterium]
MATRLHFQSEIESLRAGMVEMASIVLNQVERAVAAWDSMDAGAAEMVLLGDDRVDERCATLDMKIFDIQLLEAPVASDQRLLHVGLIAVVALERVGDLAVAIAQLTLGQRPENAIPEVQQLIGRMSAQAVDTLAVAVQAIARSDVELGDRAIRQAAAVRQMLDDVLEAVGTATNEPATRSWGASAVLMARHLERVANNGSELGGRVRFLVTGEPFIHQPTLPGSVARGGS